MSTASSEDDEWEAIPTQGRAGAQAWRLESPGGLCTEGGPQGWPGWVHGQQDWKRIQNRKKSKMQRTFNAKLRNLNSLFR